MYPVGASYLGTETETPIAAWTDSLALIFKDINSKQPEIRTRGASQLQTYVAEQTQEMKGEYFANFMSDVNRYIKDMTKGTSPHAVLAGILALNSLLGVEFDMDDGTFATQWSSYLRTALTQSESLEVSQEASKCLGRFARIYQGTLPREFLDYEVREALEWLSPKQNVSTSKRQTGVFVLAELFHNVPSLIPLDHVDTFILLMDNPLQSTDSNLRSGTVEVVRWSLRLIKSRTPEQRHIYYSRLYAIPERVFQDRNSSPDSLHGALLLLGVLFAETGTFLSDKLNSLSEILLSLRSHKTPLIKKTLIQIIPKLAKFQIEYFVSQNLLTWTSFLVLHAQPKKTERSAALEAIGKVALLLKDRIKSQVDAIMPVLSESFALHAKSKGTSGLMCPELFDCLAAMAEAVGDEIHVYMHPILPNLFATEFTQLLVDTLARISKHVPTVRQNIQENLLNILSLILAKEPLASVAPGPTTFQSTSTGNLSNKSGDLSSPPNLSAPTSPRHSSGTITPGTSGTSIPASPRPKDNSFPWLKTFFPPVPNKTPSSAPSAAPAQPSAIANTSSLPGTVDINIQVYDWDSPDPYGAAQYGSNQFGSSPGSGTSSGPGSLTHSIDLRSTSIGSNSLNVPQNNSAISTKEPLTENMISRLILALDTLATFDFDPEITKHLIHRVVVNYLDNENAIIRKRSVIACGKLLLQQGELRGLRGYAAQMTNYVLSRLFTVSLTDSDSDIRCAVLSALDTRFDSYLAQPNFLKQMFLFLYDPVFEIRESAIELLGRLASKNPGYIFPTVRSTMLELLKHLTGMEEPHKQEMAARLLGLTIRKFPKLTNPYVKPLTEILISISRKSQYSKLVAHSLSALGDLAEVAGPQLVPFLDEMLPIVIDAFQDQTSSSKREKALKALSQIIENTGYVIDELLSKYPKLLDVILNKIKREDSMTVRCGLVRLLGIIGALDPYKHKELQLAMLEADDKTGAHQPTELLMKGVNWNSSEYYPAVALTALIKFLRNPYGNHLAFQPMVIQAVMTIFKSLGTKCGPYLKHFIPLFHRVMKTCGDLLFGLRELVFQQLCILVSIIKHFTRDYLKDLLEMVNEYWDSPKLLPHIMTLIEEISQVLGDEFHPCLKQLIPKMLGTLHKDAAHGYQNTARILRSFEVFSELMDDYLHLVVPVIINLISETPMSGGLAPGGSSMTSSHVTQTPRFSLGNSGTSPVPAEIQQIAIISLGQLLIGHDVTKYSISIIHPLVRLLERAAPAMVEPIMEALSNIAVRLNQEFRVFMPMIHSVLTKQGIRSIRYSIVCHAILRGEQMPVIPSNMTLPPRSPSPKPGQSNTPVPQQPTPLQPSSNFVSSMSLAQGFNPFVPRTPSPSLDHRSSSSKFSSPSIGPVDHNGGDSNNLATAWDISRCFTKTDWIEWIRKLSIVLLSESTSPALRSCAHLAKAHYPLARELFNAAFISCWSELTYEMQTELTNSLEIALSSQNIPPEILQILLDLAEFMEHNEKSLPIDTKILASLAIKCHAYAKALYYKEAEFRRGVSPALMEDLISINYQLQLHEAAQGMLKRAQDTPGITIKLSWYEKLQRWSTALEAYEKQQLENPKDIEITLGRMRCLHDLGKWDALSELCNKTWSTERLGPKKVEIATLALSASLNLNRWEMMDNYITTLSDTTLDGCFYRALLSVHKRKTEQAREYINMARDLAANELTALIGESYNRAYSVVVRIQQLSELEEISVYMNLTEEDDEEREKRDNILRLWKKRLQGVERNVEVWQSLLSVRSLVEPPKNNVHWWTKFGNLVRKSDRPNKARQILSNLLVGQNRELGLDEPIPDTFPMVKCSYLTLLWGAPATRKMAISQMEQWVAAFPSNNRISSKEKARCYAKLARWQLTLFGRSLDENKIQTIYSTSKNAIEKANDWYRAWHVWALVNYRFVVHYENLNLPAKVDIYLLPAITGFIKSIVLAPYDNLQDTLQLLTLWFRHGKKQDVEKAMNDGFDVISIDKWLPVIPQLMARIHIALRSVRQGIHRCLSNVGKHHPQALVFPLSVAKQSPFATRVTAAQAIMTSLRSHSAELVDETLLVSSELIRVAILWKEKWYKSLDEASRYYYIEKKTDAMAMTLQRLNEMLERGPETISEQTFVKVFGRDLTKAWEATKEFLRTGKIAAINTAWDLYGHVFRTIKRQLSQDFDKLHLKNVSPKLLAVDSLTLGIPGTYQVGKPIVHIKSFNPILKVISSKQQPRKIVIHGTDGIDYGFLLKGHEDLRQDERVMQLFGLVNTFLSIDAATVKSHLSIRRFAVVPLSPNTGLIEWVPHCDTIHELIKHYRKTHNIPIDAEQIIITRLVPKPDIFAYYKLSLLQKLEVFQAALDGTSSFDLERAFYLNSKGSEDWLERRTTYTRSLAVISMVGYILGLGDRHPNNFLLSRNTGKIMHIDFGDCFEVAMQREKYAEKVPFRLTRMLVSAMEVCGIQGTFRFTSEAVMRVLRANADSIIAVLEAFVYDPLINWRLISTPLSPSPNAGFADTSSSALNLARDGANPLDDDDETIADGDDDSPVNVTGAVREGFEYAAQQNLESGDMHEALNAKALSVIQRVSNKLSGTDFAGKGTLDESTQVGLLMRQATSTENLCSAFLGFCGYW